MMNATGVVFPDWHFQTWLGRAANGGALAKRCNDAGQFFRAPNQWPRAISLLQLRNLLCLRPCALVRPLGRWLKVPIRVASQKNKTDPRGHGSADKQCNAQMVCVRRSEPSAAPRICSIFTLELARFSSWETGCPRPACGCPGTRWREFQATASHR